MRYVADFDSATALHRALAASLQDRPFDRLGQARWLAALVRFANVVPVRLRQEIYRWGGWSEAVRPTALGQVSWERFGRWVTSHYPQARFPAAFVGATNGAAVHLAAAMGAPWLPQTFLVPVRRHGDPDDAFAALRFGQAHAWRLLDEEPDLQLHHMHDPNQDRLMVAHMTYFRVKGRRLGTAYRRLLTHALPPAAPIVLVECTARWPVTEVSERHVFQHGAVGGMEPAEYQHGSDRVARFLAAQGSRHRSWSSPSPTQDAPEAEWGFAPALADDVLRFSADHQHPVVRLSFDHPEQLSLAVAELYRRWYDHVGVRQRRLIVGSFVMAAPHRVRRHRAVPLWLSFNVEDSADTLGRHLDEHPDYNDVLMLLFSHGVESVGIAAIDRWRGLLDRTPNGQFVGVDPSAYPADFAAFARYGRALALATDDAPPPPALDPGFAWEILGEVGPPYGVSVDVLTP